VGASEPLAGAGILEDIPGPFGLLLWQASRDAALWAATTDEQRVGLFTEDAEPRRLADLLSIGPAADRIEEPLRALARMLSHAPDTAPEVVTLACERVSRWAEKRELLSTALAFSQAAAVATPASGRLALRVGRLARQLGEYVRAEAWLQRAIILARQQQDRNSHAFAYAALGNLYRLRGNLPNAERHHLRALRLATRFSLRAREAAALHDLFVVCMETNRAREAVEYAGRALALGAYGRNSNRLPSLANDIAVFWVEQGDFARALPVLRAVWPHMDPVARPLGTANIARAAGALGERDIFDRYWERTLELMDSTEGCENHPTALLNLARGAASLSDWDRAEHAGLQARDLAGRLSEHKVSFEAENLLQAIQSERAAASAQIAPRQANINHDSAADELALELTTCLSGVA
jgi:tetratricopeptide (TPR) repeat protein